MVWINNTDYVKQYFIMSRGIKDLRELINISRLSFHGEIDENESTWDTFPNNNKQQKPTSPRSPVSEIKTRLKCPPEEHVTKTAINSRFKPLPAIKSSNTTTKTATVSKVNPKQKSSKIDQEVSCKTVLGHIEPDAVHAWLIRANDTINLLSNWISTEDNFVKFAHFWLSEITKKKQKELIQLETEIITDEITFALKTGIQHRLVTQQDVMVFFQVILWEYPAKLCGTNNCIFLLNTLLTLASGKKEEYRQLLSNVNSSTKDPDHIHWILSARSFALISIVASIVDFYLSLSGDTLVGVKSYHMKVDDLKNFLVLNAVKLGYSNVLEYFIVEQNIDISHVKNENDSTVLFLAVTNGDEDMVKYILQVWPDVDMNQVSNSGNSLLHVAVNTGNISLVQLLLTAGADVNQANVESYNAMPLHLAVMQGDSSLVSILLNAGADVQGSMYEAPECCSPLKLAQDLGMTDIVDIMTSNEA